jgi:hypothetical protein
MRRRVQVMLAVGAAIYWLCVAAMVGHFWLTGHSALDLVR